MRHRSRLLPIIGLILFFTAAGAFAQAMNVITVAGGTTGGGYIDANGTNARFSYPHSVVADSLGNVIVSDRGNHAHRDRSRRHDDIGRHRLHRTAATAAKGGALTGGSTIRAGARA